MNYFQIMMTGTKEKIYVPPLGLWATLMIWYHTLVVIYQMKRTDSNKLLHQLNNVSTIRTFSFKREIDRYLFARRVVFTSSQVIQFFHKRALCLERSIAISTSLRIMGLPSQVVIGQRAAMAADEEFECHAWVELDGVPINDYVSRKYWFNELYRVPESKEGELA